MRGCNGYAHGAKAIIASGLTIGIARGILVLMEDAKIIDTIICFLANAVRALPLAAYQFGDGFTNNVVPTSAVLWGALAMAGGVPYDKYLRWIMPLFAVWLGLGAVFVVIANVMRLGPF